MEPFVSRTPWVFPVSRDEMSPVPPGRYNKIREALYYHYMLKSL